MAQPVIATLGSWQGDNVSVSAVEAALTGLRRRERRAAVRTSVLTFVVVIDGPDIAPEVVDVVRRLGGRHPSRTVVVVLDDTPGRGIDGEAAIHLVQRDGGAVCFEEVVLRVRGQARWHLHSVVDPLTLADVPVAIWWPFRLPALGDPLLGVADRVIIDSRFLADTDDLLRRIGALDRRFPVADLSWSRLTSWRSLLAGLFEGPCLGYLAGVRRVEVAGHPGPRHLLGGWLMAALALGPDTVHLEAAEHVSVRIDAAWGGRHGRFAVERCTDEKLIDAWVDIPGVLHQKQTVPVLHPTRSEVLASALSRMGRDVLYDRSLACALALIGAKAAVA